MDWLGIDPRMNDSRKDTKELRLTITNEAYERLKVVKNFHGIKSLLDEVSIAQLCVPTVARQINKCFISGYDHIQEKSPSGRGEVQIVYSVAFFIFVNFYMNGDIHKLKVTVFQFKVDVNKIEFVLS